MKRLRLCVLTLLVTGAAEGRASTAPVVDTGRWERTYAVTSPEPNLVVRNIWGDVRIRAGEPGRIVVSVDRRLSAPDAARFERAESLFAIRASADETGVVLSVGEPGDRWYRQEPCRDCRADYQFDIVVPPGTALDVQTVNDGDVEISAVTGAITASNVNGPVVLRGARACTTVDNVNGDVEIVFAATPVSDCGIETVNGDVRIGLPRDAGLDVSFDLFNGSVNSEFEVEPLAWPASVETLVEDDRRRYRLRQSAGFRVGRGGTVMRIASINGDVRIRKNP